MILVWKTEAILQTCSWITRCSVIDGFLRALIALGGLLWLLPGGDSCLWYRTNAHLATPSQENSVEFDKMIEVIQLGTVAETGWYSLPPLVLPPPPSLLLYLMITQQCGSSRHKNSLQGLWRVYSLGSLCWPGLPAALGIDMQVKKMAELLFRHTLYLWSEAWLSRAACSAESPASSPTSWAWTTWDCSVFFHEISGCWCQKVCFKAIVLIHLLSKF